MQKFTIPFGSWHEESTTLEFPDNWNVTMFSMQDAPEITDPQPIESAIDNPIGTGSIDDLARGKHDAAIAVDDISRSTRLAPILEPVLQRLNEAGIDDEHITIIAAVGAHRPLTREDFIKKIGLDILERCNVVNHNPHSNLVHAGESKLGTPIFVNKTYFDASLKISIGGVVPHPLAGFGGGAKIILPGICGLQTLEANHRYAIRGGTGIGLGRVTDLRLDIEDVCAQVGLDFSINVVYTSSGKTAGVFAGDYVQAHRQAMEMAKTVYKIEIPPGTKFDVGFFNSFPEDTDLSQFTKVLSIIGQCTPIIDRKGIIAIITAASEGRGYHLIQAETGAPLQMHFDESDILWPVIGHRHLALFSPNVTRADVLHYFTPNIIFKKDFGELLQALEAIIGNNPNACLFQNTLQLR